MSYNYWTIASRLDAHLGRYECVDGKSNKFWECLKDGDHPGNYATRWGSIKQTKTKNNIKVNMTKMEAATKIAEKLNKGYKQVATSDDVMNMRVAEEEAALLSKGTAPLAAEVAEVAETPPPARRRL